MAGISAGTIEAFLTLDTTGFSMGLQQAGRDLQTFSDGSRTAGDRMSALGGVMVGVGTTLTKGVTLPILGIGTAAAKTAMDFEYQMSRVEAISGATGSNLEMLEEQAKELGKSTQYSAIQAASAMEVLGSAGFEATEIYAAMPGLLDLAATDNIELANAAEIAATALRGFGLEADQVGHVADVLARSAADTNASVESMGYSFKYVATVAEAADISLEETAAAIGILSDAGIKGTKSGTTLRSIITRMINPTEKAKEVMGELGIEFYNTDGTMKSLSEIITIVNEKTSGLTQEQRNQALSTIYGQQALTGMLALMEAGPEKIDELTNSYLNCDGAATDMAATINDNTKGAWIEFKSALEGAAIAIGDVLLPHLRKGIEWLTNMVTAFGNLDPAIQENIVKWGTIAAAIGPVLIIGGKFVGLVGTIVSAVSSLGGAFATLAGPAGWIVLAGTAIAGLIVSWNAMQDNLDRSTKGFESASNNLESFEGKVRSTDYLLAEVFGKEIEIKFSADWEGVKEQAQTFYTDLNNDLKSYYEEKSRIDHDGCTDLELHEKHKMDIKEKYAKLQAQQMAQNTQLEGRHDEIMNQLTPFLMEEGLSSLTAGDLQGQMSPWIKEKIRLVQEGEQEIYDIYENAYIMQRELTSVEQARVLELEEQLGKDRAILTTNNMNDLMEVWELEHEAEKAMINDRAKTYRKYSESVEDAVWDAAQTVNKSIDEEIEDLKRRETQWGVSCQEEIEALKGKQFAIADFSEDYGRRTQANIDKGQEFATASKNAFESIVRDLENGSIHVEDFGLTQEEYLSLAIQTMIEAGASADELADAINLIPEDKRSKVLADIQGKIQAEELKKAIDKLNDKTVKVITQYENWYTDKNTGKKYGYQNGNAGYYATGTEHALSGVATVAEYGPEIIANNNTAMLATGRQMVNLSGGEKIYNARQTKDILDNMGKSTQIDYSDSLRIINSNIILLKEAIERKNFNNVVNNNIEKIDINEVANIEEIEYQLTEMMERRTYGGV